MHRFNYQSIKITSTVGAHVTKDFRPLLFRSKTTLKTKSNMNKTKSYLLFCFLARSDINERFNQDEMALFSIPNNLK